MTNYLQRCFLYSEIEAYGEDILLCASDFLFLPNMNFPLFFMNKCLVFKCCCGAKRSHFTDFFAVMCGL